MNIVRIQYSILNNAIGIIMVIFKLGLILEALPIRLYCIILYCHIWYK